MARATKTETHIPDNERPITPTEKKNETKVIIFFKPVM